MPYWGSGPDDNDYAFDQVGSYIAFIKDRMLKSMATVLEKGYPEQSIIASLACLRAIGEVFPKNLSVSVDDSVFSDCKRAFEEWFTKVRSKVPAKHRDGILAEAQKEFALFEERILKVHER